MKATETATNKTSDKAMKTALKKAARASRKGSDIEQAVEDADDAVANLLKKVNESPEDFMILPKNDSVVFASGQMANSLSYFGLRNLVWVAAITELDYNEVVREEHFAPAARIAGNFRKYYSRGDDVATHGVDHPAEVDADGRTILQEDPSMDGGTDKRKRLSEAQFDILEQNANRYLDCAAGLAVLRENDIEPTQPMHDYKNAAGKDMPGTLTRVIQWHANYIEERNAKQANQNSKKVAEMDKADAALGDATLSAFGL